MTKLKDNFYLHVNEEWLKDVKIPEGKPAINSFIELLISTEEKLMKDIDDIKNCDDKYMNEFIKLYKQALDLETREKYGLEPIKKYIDFIEKINNFEDLNKEMAHLILNDIPLPFNIFISANMGKEKIYNIYYDVPQTILFNKDVYYSEKKEKLLNIFKEMTKKLLSSFYSEDKISNLIDLTIKFDNSLLEYLKNSEELSHYTEYYNPRNLEDLKSYSKYINLWEAPNTLVGNKLDMLSITQPKYFENIDKIVNPDTFESIKAWMIVMYVYKNSNILTEEFRLIGDSLRKATIGVEKSEEYKKYYYNYTKSIFKDVVGIYYAKKYFGEKAKNDVENMCKKIIQTYIKRLKENTWLKKETINKAISKVKKINLLIGYPDKVDEVYSKFKIKDNISFFENIKNLQRISFIHELKKYKKEIDKDKWNMSADTINAYYSPTNNLICFPAAILQEPFYSINQSKSKNYGAIGAVIAHEISHAFDNNGSKIDENGVINNWWDEEDFNKFNELVEKMVLQFDGLEVENGKVNGRLTVSENIADNGGLAASLETLKNEEEYNLEEFFTSWARMWRMKASPEYISMLLSLDVHGPAILRANKTVQNFDEFYEVFNIEKGDKMFMNKEERLIIW